MKDKTVQQKLAASKSPFAILFEPVHQLGPEDKGKRISSFEATLRSEYRRALEGNLPSQKKKILKLMRANERARAERDQPRAKTIIEPMDDEQVDYDIVLRLLGIAVRLRPPAFDLNGPDGELGFFDMYPSLKLQAWAFNAAVQRRGITDDRKLRSLHNDAIPSGEECHEAVTIVPDPPRRDPKETRFQKGRSGNPNGRPRKPLAPKPLPLASFLDEEVAVRWNGQLRQVTRGQLILLKMLTRAQEGYAGVSRALIDLGAEQLLHEWKRKEPEVTVLRWFGAEQRQEPLLTAFTRLQIIRRRRGMLMLEPWIVERAVARLERELTELEQIAVVRATTMPRKVNWPNWWLPHLRDKAPPRPRKKKPVLDW